MEINDSFRVDLPVDEAWRVLMDIERIAPCLPGAQLQEIAGDEYRGVVKVKVGPITAQYKGAARFESRDEATRTAVIVGSGRDTRGQGNASATITMRLTEDGPGTAVAINTDLSITGKVAQFGRGVMADVSAKLLAQFVTNLERDVLSQPAVDLVAADAAEAAEAAAGATTPTSTPTAATAIADSALSGPPSGNGALKGDHAVTVRTIDSPDVAPVDLLEMGGTPVLKRLAPFIGIAVAFVLWRLLRRRRSARRG
ncbi:MAG: SRPBCC family protein [Acidimicrobiia bacterium]